MWSCIENDMLRKKYTMAFISTTAKHSDDFLRLPDKEILGDDTIHLLVTNESIATKLFKYLNGKVPDIFIDIERKQEIDLMKLAEESINDSRIHPYKPNDITVEAADQLLLYHFQGNLTGKNVLLYGNGNINAKLAIRLTERNANVYLYGRNQKKSKDLANAINLILPAYSPNVVRVFDDEELFDAMVSFISAEKVITSDFVAYLKSGGIALDGGIGNYTEEFIFDAINKGINVLRLDVRIGLPFLEASTKAVKHSFFQEIMGQREISNISIVAGGIIGASGSVIVDRIDQPKQIIGVANGIGGVKNESTLSDHDKRAIKIINEYIIQSKQEDL
ncbi:hypothetical protein [Lederbergia citri]|uniref:Uncharacterized protein n=1 Tax=Lederbergia citri TaxID=2833580 RepID=A0A942YHF4_9BACI|nr:hypothetical protein [Lederbergia citri]MBS4195724.1 hypothetical protein [Lederbergia citri]